MLVWSFKSRQLNISRVEHLHDRKIVLVGSYSVQIFHKRLEMWNLEHNQTIVPKQMVLADRVFKDCIMGNPVDEFEVFVSDSLTVQQVLASLPQTVNQGEQMYEWSELEFVEELVIPTTLLLMSNEASVTMVEKELVLNMSQVTGITDDSSFNYNVLSLNFRYGFYNLSNTDKRFLGFFLNSSSISYLNSQPQLSLNVTSKIDQLISPNTVYCFIPIAFENHLCTDNPYFGDSVAYEISNFSVIAFGIIYYLCLATVFKH